MILDILYFVLGVGLIIGGANYLTEGASTLARRFGVSPLVVGLTIVAFGTSSPELIVSLTSALKGSADISLGNVVGSNLFNILAIGGVTALVAPISITRGTLKREIPLMLLASFVLSFMVLDRVLDPTATANMITRSEGLTLLAFFLIFLSYTFAIAKGHPGDSHAVSDSPTSYPLWLHLLFIWGGDLFVSSASSIASALGMSESFIGLTIVAAGTSLPELATSVAAALKKQPEIAVGNIVGSNIFNIFFILGTTATVQPIRAGGIGVLDLVVMTAAALLLYIFALLFGDKVIKRGEGFILLSCYIAYTIYLITQL